MNNYLNLHPEVAQALAERRPVVALESTIISHGMPYPDNVAMAQRVEQLIRDGGATPATIAVLDGKLHVGLHLAQIERLAQGGGVLKLSRRDLGYALANGHCGGTTVSATMIGAALTGIRVFATGGIGGVHRGAQHSFDISADLLELAQTPVAVVSAGAKSILDLPATLEYLETQGVPVLGYQTERFPAFFTRDSGLPVSARIDTVAQLAATLRAHWGLGLRGGVLIANPVPEAQALDAPQVEAWITQALSEARAQGVRGKDETPFLLRRLVELSAGRTLAANNALVENNARLGAALAVALVAAQAG